MSIVSHSYYSIKRLPFILILLILSSTSVHASWNGIGIQEIVEDYYRFLSLSTGRIQGDQTSSFPNNHSSNKDNITSDCALKRNWQSVIDSVWGPGISTERKLAAFDEFWSLIDSNFASFNNLAVAWDSLGIVFRAEITDTVSRGRFVAIMNHLSLALKDAHTWAAHNTVNFNSPLTPGKPLMVIGGWYDCVHFGAGLTPLPDSSLLVYKTVNDHPLGLEPGDIVLGYDGIPWKNLYKELLSEQLPLRRQGSWGSSDHTLTHSLLMAAGMNWHLFDTIAIVKYDTGDTLHLPTESLHGQTASIICSEQMAIPGVPMPRYFTNNETTSYGAISGTQIGYIYQWVWAEDAENEFYDALYTLTTDPTVEGLIVDFRFNMGGNMFLSNRGLELIFRDSVTTICFSKRTNPDDHYDMSVSSADSFYVIPGNGVSWYDKPIAVLTGPGAVSSGDQVAFRMSFHPSVKLFGKSTNTAFDAPYFTNPPPGWFFMYAGAEASLASDTTYFLTHRDLNVDVPVWLTRDDVARGEDTVVNAAIEWIESVVVRDGFTATPHPVFLNVDMYPNPASDFTCIDVSLTRKSPISIRVYDVWGRQMLRTLFDRHHETHHTMPLDIRLVPSGVYFCRITTPQGNITRALPVLR